MLLQNLTSVILRSLFPTFKNDCQSVLTFKVLEAKHIWKLLHSPIMYQRQKQHFIKCKKTRCFIQCEQNFV